MIRLGRLLLAYITLFCLTGADHWDRFRGPNSAGVVDDPKIPLTFGAKDNVVWKLALPGSGNGSPVVWGDRLFIQTASADSKLRILYCIDTANGKFLWQRSVSGVAVTIRADSSSASSTPTVDGEAVYVCFWDGKNAIMAAHDFEGDKLWSRNLGDFNSQHGVGASPILYKDKLILANDMDKDDFVTKVVNVRPSILIALNKRTGELIWEMPRTAERACYSAPFLRQKPGGEPELIVTSSTAVTGYNPDTGSKLWEAKSWQEYALKSLMRTVATPALAGDMLCVCSGGDAGRFAIGLALPDGKRTAPERLWDNRKDFPYVPSPLARGEHFYFVNDYGFAGCYHVRTGKRIWFERLSDAGFVSSPLLVNGKVYAANTAGDVFVFAAEPSFNLLARNDLGEAIRATPAVSGGRLFIRGEQHLYCIGK